MGFFNLGSQPGNINTFLLLGILVASALSTPLEILNYKDEEAGHGHVMSGEPGVQVEGEYFWKAPEDDSPIKLVYSAGAEGYVAVGDHLPLSPAVPEAPVMELPVMVDFTPEVAEARSAFMKVFDEVKMREARDEVEENAVDDMVVVDADSLERKRRDADPQLNYFNNFYAPAYPHYYVYPTVSRVVEAEESEDVDTEMKDEDEMVAEKNAEGVKYYTPSYQYYPGFPSVVYPFQQVAPVKAVSNVQVRYPLYQQSSYPGYPALTFNPTNQVVLGQPQPVAAAAGQPGSRILPEQVQEGEDEPAALLL